MRNTIVLLIGLLLFGCNSVERKQASGYAQGTTYSVIYYSNGSDIQYQVDSLLLAFDRALSTYQGSSYISKWNSNEVADLEQPQLFKEVVNRAKEIHEATDGALDITVGPLMTYWFGNDWNTASIDTAELNAIMQHVGMEKVFVENGTITRTDSALRLDVNAIAQGYSVDVLCRYLESLGISDYLVEIGGEVRTSGRKPDGDWTVGVDSPDADGKEREVVISVQLKDAAMATSGNYRKYVEIDGVKYGHTLDPKTGFPATTNVLSATVIAKNCMTADAYATAFMVLGAEKAKAIITSNPDLEGILIHSNEDGGVETWMSEGVQTVAP